MDNVYEKLMTCLASVRQKTDFVPEVALITWIRSGKLCGAY